VSHKEQRNYCKRMQLTFPTQFIGKSVLDVGSMDVNGDNRWLFRDACYMGIDVSPGRNVDRVCKVQDVAEVFDFVISTEVLEHDPEWWVTLDEMCKRVRPGGAATIIGMIPVGTKIAGADGLISEPDTLVGDAARGAALYTSKTCITCHGATGAGNGPIPALWGPGSYSVGASMTRLERAASFIRHNMPQTAPGTLTAQEAFDLSAYINSQPRPDSPGKEGDWPMGGAPADVPYDTKGHKAFNPPPLLPRANPRGALVPNPPVVGRSNR